MQFDTQARRSSEPGAPCSDGSAPPTGAHAAPGEFGLAQGRAAPPSDIPVGVPLSLRTRPAAGPLVACVLGATALGLLVVLVLPDLRHSPGAAAVSVALAAFAGMVVGAPAWALAAIASRAGITGRLARWAGPLSTRDHQADRRPVAAAHAYATVTVVWAALAVAGAFLLFKRLWVLQESEFAIAIAVLATVLMVAAAPAVVALLGRHLTRVMLAVDRKLSLPWPPQPELRYLLVAAPLGWLLFRFNARYGEFLNQLRTATPVLLVLLASGLFALLGRRLRLSARPRTLAAPAIVALGLACTATAALAFPRLRNPASVERSPAAALGANLLRTLTDVDFDGASSLLGGGDCAPFDKRRGPTSEEIPGNAVDENCDGRVATAASPLADASRPLFSGALTPGSIRKYNIVWIVMDAVRAGSSSVITGGKPTTPALQRFAEEATVFTRAYSATSTTGFSFPSMLVGKSPGNMSWEKNGPFVRTTKAEKSIAENLRVAGYRTGMVLTKYSNEMFEGATDGFQQLLVVEPAKGAPAGWANRRAPYTNLRAIDFIVQSTPAELNPPFFLMIHYPDAHNPYVAHAETMHGFDDSELGRYESEIAFTDMHVGILLDYLRARPEIFDNTIVIVTADHGEEFKEHGSTAHARTCYVESIRVPLLLRVPGMRVGRIDAPVSLVDLKPTLLELTGLSPGEEQLDGQSLLVPMLQPERVDAQRPILCGIASLNKKTLGDFLRFGLYQGDFALLQDVYRSRFELYDLAADPGELHDLSGEPAQRDRIAKMKSVLSSSHTGNLKPPWRF